MPWRSIWSDFGLGTTPACILGELRQSHHGIRSTAEGAKEKTGQGSEAEGWLEIRNLLSAMASLALADDLGNEGTIAWCTFFVRGIHDDMERLTRLQDLGFLMKQLIAPAIDRLVASGGATRAEATAMLVTGLREVVKAGDLAEALPGTPSQRSVAIHSMLERGLLIQDERGPRFYRLPLATGALAPFIVRQLDTLGYLPRILKDDDLTAARAGGPLQPR